MVAIDDFILVALCLTFGGAANPSQWSDVSELTCDLTNDIVRDEGWDHQVLQSPHHAMIGNTPELEAPDVPLAPASALAVTLPPDDVPKSNCYIDDLFAAFLEHDFHRGSGIIPFVLHLVGRPIAVDESLKCDDILSLSKFLAETMPAEQKMILGWIMDTCRLQIELPANKHTAWTATIHSLLTADQATFKELEKLLGRLNHAGFVIPLARHFLGWLWMAMFTAQKQHSVKLQNAQCQDLALWLRFVNKAHAGLSLNLLTFCLPSHILWSDASLHGIGGLSVTSGIARWWELPWDLRLCASLNALEFLASYITIYMDIHVGATPTDSCFLSQGDSTSATGWLCKSNFDDAEPLHLSLTWAMANLIMDHNSCLYSQWFPGNENNLTDALSRDTHLDDDALLTLLLSHVPKQIPEGFCICPLLLELVSQITTWLRNLPALMESPGAPQRSKLATGATGKYSSTRSNLMVTHSSLVSPRASSTTSSLPLPRPSVPMMSRTTQVHQRLLHQYLTQSVPPSMLWHRPTGLTTGQAQYTMMKENSLLFYSNS